MQVFRQHNEDYEKQVEAGMKAKGTLLKYRTVYKHMQESVSYTHLYHNSVFPTDSMHYADL